MEKYLVEVHNSLIGKNSLRKDENDLLRANLRVPAVRKHLKNTHFTFLEQSNQNVIAVIKLVISYFEERKEKALQEEHEEDVYGRF